MAHGGRPPVTSMQAQQVQCAQPVHLAQGAPAQPGINSHYNVRAGQWTGWIQIACGVSAIVLGIVCIVTDVSHGHIGTGIWSGLLFYISTGILGVLSVKRSYEMIIGYMTMSIISSIVAGVSIIIFASSAATERWYGYYVYLDVPWGVRLTFDLLSLLVAVVEFVTCIVAAAVCCSGSCCAPYSAVATRTVVQYSHVPPGAIITGMPQGTVAYTTTQHYVHPPVFNQAPMYNNYIQPMNMHQFQPPMQQQQQPLPVNAENPGQGQSPPPLQGAEGEMPPPYEMQAAAGMKV